MSGDGDAAGRLGPRTLLLIALVGAAIGAGLVAAATTDRAPVSDDVPLVSPDGVQVNITTGNGIDLQTGYPFPASNAVTIRNWTVIGATGAAELNLTSWNRTHIGVGNVGGDDVQINYTKTATSYGAAPAGLGRVTFNRSLNVSESADFVEANYTASSQPTLRLFDLNVSQGRGVVALAPNGNAVDAAAADSNGDVAFTELPSGSVSLNFEKGAADLRIFNKSAPNTLVTKDIRVRFYDKNGNLDRQVIVSDGTVDLSGLDQSDAYTITFKDVSNTPQYESQTISLTTLFEQTEVYLMPRAEPTATIIFKLKDLTGNFPGASTDLKVEEPITKDYDGDNQPETKYQDVSGGNFGSDNQLTLVLADQETFRLRVVNTQTNASRLMGNYQTTGNDTVTLEINQVTVPVGSNAEQGWAIDGTIVNKSGQRLIKVNYKDLDDLTSEVRLNYTFRNNGSSFHTETLNGPLGTTSVTYDITSHNKSLGYVIHYEIDRNGTTHDGALYLGKPGDVNVPLDPRWTGILGIIGIVAVGGLTVIIDDSLGALSMTLVAAVLSMLGVVSIPGAAIGMAGGISVLAVVGRPD